MDFYTGFEITSQVCDTCGTEVLRDEETYAEVHRDPVYDKLCAKGRKTQALVDLVGGKRPKRHLWVVR